MFRGSPVAQKGEEIELKEKIKRFRKKSGEVS
jgi:hypothetical protein